MKVDCVSGFINQTNLQLNLTASDHEFSLCGKEHVQYVKKGHTIYQSHYQFSANIINVIIITVMD